MIMNDWYNHYKAETYRRHDEIKFAEIQNLAKYGPSAPAAQKIHQRFFDALRAWIIRRDTRSQDQHLALRQDQAREQLY